MCSPQPHPLAQKWHPCSVDSLHCGVCSSLSYRIVFSILFWYVDLLPITNYPSDSQATSRPLSSIELKQDTQSAEFRLLPTFLEKYNLKDSEALTVASQGSTFCSHLPSGTRFLSTNFRFMVKYQKLWPVFHLCHFLHFLSLEFEIPVPVQILLLMLNICSQETVLFPEYK